MDDPRYIIQDNRNYAKALLLLGQDDPVTHTSVVTCDAAATINRCLDIAEKYLAGYEAAMRIVKSTYPEKFDGSYFICGALGSIDENDLPDKLMICPAYGCDWSQIYEKSEKTTGPQW